MKRLIAILVATLSTSTVAGADTPTIVGGDGTTISVNGAHVQGERRHLDGTPDAEFTQDSLIVGARRRWFRKLTEDGFSNRLGLELRIGAGYASDESPVVNEGKGAQGHAGASVPFRFFTFNAPVWGALYVEPGLDLELGGARWWSTGFRAEPILTLRAAMAFTRRIGFELRWVGVPIVLGSSPGNLIVTTWERRLGLDLFVGPAGVGIEIANGHNATHMMANGTMNYAGLSDEQRVTVRVQVRY